MTTRGELRIKFERGAELVADDSLTDSQRIAAIRDEFGVGDFDARQVIAMVSGSWTADDVEIGD